MKGVGTDREEERKETAAVTDPRTRQVSAKPTRAMQLIEMLLRDELVTEDALARELVVPPKLLADYRSGKTPIPPQRQLCLALFMTQLSPKYARMGYALRDQIRASATYKERAQA